MPLRRRAPLLTLAALAALAAAGLRGEPPVSGAAPVVVLDQAGALVAPGSPLTGEVRGDGVVAVTVTSPCVRDGGGSVVADDGDHRAAGVQLSVPTDAQAPIGRCPVSVEVALDDGRTLVEPGFVVMPGFTALPELVHVERVSTSTGAGHAVSEVRYLFDEPARLVPATAEQIRFTLTTYDVQGSHIATSVRQDGDAAVIATFGTGGRPVGEPELRQVSYGTAFQGAVLGADGRPSPAGTAHLNPRQTSAQAHTGPTWAADLLRVTDLRPDPRRPGSSLVDFRFDSPLEAGEPPNERVYAFDVVLGDGTGHRCASLARLPAQQVTVSCPGLLPTAGVVARGVVSAPGFGSDEPLAGSLLTRRPTATPDVAAVAWGPGPDRLTVTFDEPVELVAAERFLVAGPHPPAAGAGQRAEVAPADPRSVVVTLQGTQLDLATLLTVRGRAVLSSATGRENVFEQVELAPRRTEQLPAGTTLLPDLVGLRIGPDAVARYVYDAVLLPGDEEHRPVEDLRLYLPDGTELVCRGARLEPGAAPAEGGSVLACHDYGVGGTGGATATPDQVRAATYGTAVYDTPPAARVVEGALRPGR